MPAHMPAHMPACPPARLLACRLPSCPSALSIARPVLLCCPHAVSLNFFRSLLQLYGPSTLPAALAVGPCPNWHSLPPVLHLTLTLTTCRRPSSSAQSYPTPSKTGWWMPCASWWCQSQKSWAAVAAVPNHLCAAL